MLSLIWWLQNSTAADVDLEAGIRWVWTIDCPSQMLLSNTQNTQPAVAAICFWSLLSPSARTVPQEQKKKKEFLFLRSSMYLVPCAMCTFSWITQWQPCVLFYSCTHEVCNDKCAHCVRWFTPSRVQNAAYLSRLPLLLIQEKNKTCGISGIKNKLVRSFWERLHLQDGRVGWSLQKGQRGANTFTLPWAESLFSYITEVITALTVEDDGSMSHI